MSADKTAINVNATGDPSATFDDFIETLPENECRYAVYDLEYETPAGATGSKIFFISWLPDSAKAMQKMVYASSLLDFKKQLEGWHLELQANDYDEITKEIMLEKVMRYFILLLLEEKSLCASNFSYAFPPLFPLLSRRA